MDNAIVISNSHLLHKYRCRAVRRAMSVDARLATDPETDEKRTAMLCRLRDEPSRSQATFVHPGRHSETKDTPNLDPMSVTIS